MEEMAVEPTVAQAPGQRQNDRGCADPLL